jgi:molybdopterin/thiamine biosynthesis adenylyltransferase
MPDLNVLSWRPRVRDSVTVQCMDDDLVFISTADRRARRFTATALARKALLLLDGTRTVAELVDLVCEDSEESVLELCGMLVTLRDEKLLGIPIPNADRASALGPEELDFYDRQIRLFQDICDEGLGEADSGLIMQERLRASTIVVCGLGGLGSHVASSLAMAGVGTLRICDFDRVEASNLSRQVLYSSGDIGAVKVTAAAARLAAVNPHIRIIPVNRRITGPADLADLVEGADVVVGCADAPSTEDVADWITDACWPSTPHIIGAAYAYHVGIAPQTVIPGRTACRYCLRTELATEYDGLRAPTLIGKKERPGVVGALAGILANMTAWEAIRLIVGLPPTLADRQVSVDHHTLTQHTRTIPQNPHCRRCRNSPPRRTHRLPSDKS